MIFSPGCAVLVGAALLTSAPVKTAPVAYQLVEGPAEIRVETSAYTLTVTREGFGWTLLRGGAPVLKSAATTGRAPNGIMLIEGRPERATTIKTIEKLPDRVVIEYGATRKKTAFRVEIRPLADRARITTVALHRDPPLHDIGSTLRFELGLGRWYGAGFQGWRSKL